MTPIEQAAQALREAKAALTHPRDGWFDDRCNLALETVNAALASLEAAKQEPLTPRWIVNDLGELGIQVGGRFFFLYKGDNIEYGVDGIGNSSNGLACHNNGLPMRYRPVGKREFGETCWPVKWVVAGRRPDGLYTDELTYTPGLSFGKPGDSDWRDLPAAAQSPGSGT